MSEFFPQMVSIQAYGIGIVVFITVTAVLYFGKKAELQKQPTPEETDKQKALAKKEEQARWSEVFDEIQEFQNDFPDVG